MAEVEQIAAELANWRRCVILRGAAGTGKTTSVRRLLPEICAMGYNPVLLAPTGRAAKVLQNRTGYEASTIHSAIYVSPEEPEWDDELETYRWKFDLKNDVPSDSVIVVDEASMVGLKVKADENLVFGSGSLLQDLIDWSGIRIPECRNRIVFVGDPYQLSPISDPMGAPPALDAATLREMTGCEPFAVELMTVHRQKDGGGILEEARRLRDCLVREDYGLFHFRKSSEVEFVEDGVSMDRYRPDVDLDRKIILAYTNKFVWEYNMSVRAALGRTSPMPVAGERLLCLRNTKMCWNEDSSVDFRNGELLEVTGISEKEMSIDGFYRIRGEEKARRWTFTFRKMTLRWTDDPGRAELSCWVNVSSIVDPNWREDEKNANVALYVAVKNNIEERYKDELSALDKDARKERVKEYLKRSQLLHAPIVTFGYALTVHKAQGGEWDEVWMDCRYVGGRNNEGYFRWAYTAVTRSRKDLKLICPPSIDDLLESFAALERSGEEDAAHRQDVEARQPAESRQGVASNAAANAVSDANVGQAVNAGQAAQGARTLDSVLGAIGLAVTEKEELSWRYRVRVRGRADQTRCGTVDVVYNGKGVVTGIDAVIPDLDEQGRNALLALRRFPVDEVMGVGSQSAASRACSLDNVQSAHRKAAERIVRAAEGWLQVVSIQSFGAFQLRLNVCTSEGMGRVDWYFDGKGRITSMYNGDTPVAVLRELRTRLESEAAGDCEV